MSTEQSQPSQAAVAAKLSRQRRAEHKERIWNTGGGAQRAIAHRVARQDMPKITPTSPVVPTPDRGGDIPFRRIPLVDLDMDADCRWVLTDDPRAALYCGLQRAEGRVYCAHHVRMAYVHPGPPRPTQYLPKLFGK